MLNAIRLQDNQPAVLAACDKPVVFTVSKGALVMLYLATPFGQVAQLDRPDATD